VTTPEATPKTRRLRSFVLAVFLGGLAIGTATYSCVPAAQRLASPIACPNGTAESVVVSHVTRNDKGTIVTVYDLWCIDADRGGTEPAGFKVFGTLSLYGMGIALIIALAVSFPRKAAAATVTIATIVLGGCEFGTVTSSEYERRYPYGAGPMFSAGRAVQATRALHARFGADVRLTSLSISPDSVSFMVVARGTRNDVDVYTYRDDGFAEPYPVQESDPDDESFTLDPAALAKVPELVRIAPRRAGIPDGHVEGLSYSRDRGAFEFYASVESPHRRGSVRFDASGGVIGTD